MKHSKLFTAASRYALHKGDVIEALKEAGLSPEVQVDFQLGYMTGRLMAQKLIVKSTGKVMTLTQAEQCAEVILSSKGSGCKNLKANERRRTDQEETLAGQARKEWSRLLILAGLKTTEKRGASTPKAKPADPAEDADNTDNAEPKAIPKAKAKDAAPRVSTAQAALMHLKSVCAELLLFENKNADALSLDMSKAIDTFRVAISGIALNMKEDSKKK